MKSKSENPVASRPIVPKEYGFGADKKGALLPWSHVTERMTAAMHYWICTISPTGAPHTTPVDALWLNDALYFGGSPKTRWHRNLAANAALSVHLESTMDVVILRGRAGVLKAPDRKLVATLEKAYKDKYGFVLPAGSYDGGGMYVFRPRLVLAWKDPGKDATRWQFKNGGKSV